VFEGPTIRLVVDVDGTPLRVAVGGLARLGLLDAEKRTVRLRLREASLVRDPAVGAATEPAGSRVPA
jgi:hypothetical protein